MEHVGFCVAVAQVKNGRFLSQHLRRTVHSARHTSEINKVLWHKGCTVDVPFLRRNLGKTSSEGRRLGMSGTLGLFTRVLIRDKTRRAANSSVQTNEDKPGSSI